MDIGIAKPTNKEFLNPKKNISTDTTRITPKIILLTRSLTWFKVIFDWSFVIVILRLLGKLSFSELSIIFLISLEAIIRFLPPLFTTSNSIVFSPKDLA